MARRDQEYDRGACRSDRDGYRSWGGRRRSHRGSWRERARPGHEVGFFLDTEGESEGG
jgi:hypothetical protein